MTGSTKPTEKRRRPRPRLQLRGSSLLLRPPRPQETSLLYEWMSDPNMAFPWDTFAAESFRVFEEGLHTASREETSLYPRFVVTRREDARPIGVTGYYRAHPVLEGYDLWYAICNPAERGKGYGTEAVAITADYLFSNTHVERLGAVCDIKNVPSYRLLESLHFRREGRLRRALFHHGGWHDAYVYGITREDWKGR